MTRFYQFFWILILLPTFCSTALATDCVVLLHGLARTSHSMDKLASVLTREGFHVANIDYPSREYSIEELSVLAIDEGLTACEDYSMVHFVTHSLGGILVRYYLSMKELPQLGRVVMLAPPNQGSEVIDHLRDMPGFTLLNGPAGHQLGTDKGSIPSRLGPVDFDLGVISGSRTLNPILSLYLPNPDDGKVSVERTRVEGMKDFIVLPHTHSLIMRATDTIEQTVLFLMTGSFNHEGASEL